VLSFLSRVFNPTISVNSLTPNDHYRGRTAPLTSKRCIVYIYSTDIGTEYFKHGIYSPFFPLQNTVCFIILTYLFPVLFTFYIQGVLKLKKNNSVAKRLRRVKTFLYVADYAKCCIIFFSPLMWNWKTGWRTCRYGHSTLVTYVFKLASFLCV